MCFSLEVFGTGYRPPQTPRSGKGGNRALARDLLKIQGTLEAGLEPAGTCYEHAAKHQLFEIAVGAFGRVSEVLVRQGFEPCMTPLLGGTALSGERLAKTLFQSTFVACTVKSRMHISLLYVLLCEELRQKGRALIARSACLRLASIKYHTGSTISWKKSCELSCFEKNRKNHSSFSCSAAWRARRWRSRSAMLSGSRTFSTGPKERMRIRISVSSSGR